jgi:hypothetical protein
MNLRLLASVVLVPCAAVLLLAACTRFGNASSKGIRMKPSVTYLRLLRHTPFFTALDDEQLRWIIGLSHEWEAEAGATVATCGAEATGSGDPYWILLDGHWQLEESGRNHVSGHADPGKWFSASAVRGDCRLVTTEHSYVMKIERKDMDAMLARGFAFATHLRVGQAYYDQLFPQPSGGQPKGTVGPPGH